MATPDVLHNSPPDTQRLVEAWVAEALLRARLERIADPDGFFADVPEAWGRVGVRRDSRGGATGFGGGPRRVGNAQSS